MNRKISVGMAVSIVILAMTVTFSITMLVAMRLFDSTVSSVKEKESMYNKIAEVDRYVRSNDYYPIDETTLYDRLTAGYLLGTGDKYARYFSATAYTELMNTQNGTLIGIGVELAVDQSGYAKVIKVYDESPAKEAGIQVGNYITAVDGTDVKSMSSVDAIQTRLRGESGTTVNVTWLDSEAAEHTADLTHSGYSSTTVDYQMVQGNVGYIRIRQFDSTTPSELDYAIRSLSASGAGSLVFDLRDNGGGIPADQAATAFLRHATSKLRTEYDLEAIGTLGFRGEALAAISAVSRIELLTRTAEEDLGAALSLEGGAVVHREEAGCPQGTTMVVRDLFYNTPARLKFMRKDSAETAAVNGLMQHLALSHPDISFQFINNGQSKLHTSGNGKLKDVIYHIYGRDIAANLLKAEYDAKGLKVTGFLGKPIIPRRNRNF